jgi:uncharacterized delta-60 repeat protein
MSQESRVGAQAFTVSWSQMLNSMNARERYFENQSVIKTTVKNKDFNNVEQVSDTFTDQPLILVVDQGTLSQLGGAGSLLTFTDLEKLQDPNLTGATKNQFNKNSVTGSTLSNNGQLVNVTVNYAKRDYNYSIEETANLKLKLTGSSQSYNFPAGVEYYQVITGGTLEKFKTLLVGEPWESFVSNYIYTGSMKFRWGKGWGQKSSFGASTNGTVNSISITPNDEIILGGNFTRYGQPYSNKLVKINSVNGSIISFTQGTTSAGGFYDGPVNVVLTTSSNETYVGGGFSVYGDPTNSIYNYIIKLNSDGTPNSTFTTNMNGGFNDSFHTPKVTDIKEQADGKIVVCGIFDEYAGLSLGPNVNIIRLNSNGTKDGGFTPPSGSIKYNKISLDENPSSPNYQKIYLTTESILGTKKVIRLNTDGSLDNTFTTQFNDNNIIASFVQSIKVDINGKILIGLGTSPLVSNNITYYGIIRLNDDGSIDTTFNNGLIGTGPDTSVNAIEIDSNDNIYVGGKFSTYNGTNRSSILKLLPTGLLDGNFSYGGVLSSTPSSIVNSIKILSNGKIVIGGSFGAIGTNADTAAANLRLLNVDGTLSTAFVLSNPVPTPLQSWRNVARGYNVYVEQVFNNFNNLDLLILTRGVDPHTPKQTIEYDISRLFGAIDGSYKIKGEYYLNVPIQVNEDLNVSDTWSKPGVSTNTWRQDHRTPISHDIVNNNNPKLYHKTFNNFTIPTNSWTAFTNNSVKYYTSTDKSRVTHKAYETDTRTLGDFSNNGVICPVKYEWVAGTSTLGTGWSKPDPTDVINPNNPIYENNVVYDQGRIEGISFLGSNIKPGEIFDLESPINFARVYAPS